MVGNDFIQSITNNDFNKGLNNRSKYNDAKKSDVFENILNTRKENFNHLASNRIDNLNRNPVKNLQPNKQIVSNKDETKKEQSKKNNIVSYVESESSKTDKNSKPLVEDENNEATVPINKDKSVDSICSYLASFAVEAEVVTEDVKFNNTNLNTEQVDESIVGIVLDGSTNLIDGEDVAKIVDTALEDQNLMDLPESDESNNLPIIDFSTKLENTTSQTKQITIHTEEEALETDTVMTEELLKNDLQSKDVISKKEQTEKQNDIPVKQTYFSEEIKSLQKDNEGKSIETKSTKAFEEEADIQSISDIKNLNIFANLNENGQSNIEKNIDNTFNTIMSDKKPIMLDKDNIFEQIVEKVKVDLDKTDEIRIKLKPDFLGEISLKISTEKGVVTAKAYVENFSVKQLIESNLDNLKDTMKELGINFEALDVSVGKDSGFEKNNSQAWKHDQKFRNKRTRVDSVSMNSGYQEEDNLDGGLHLNNSNIDLII